MKRFGIFLAAALAVSVMILSAANSFVLAMGKSPEAPRLAAEELRSQLGGADIVVIDVRVGDEWTKSNEKIQGAVREDPEKYKQWAVKYPKEKTLVFY